MCSHEQKAANTPPQTSSSAADPATPRRAGSPTPGPWIIETEPFNVWTEDGLLIAHCTRGFERFEDDEAWETGVANARLIAAAPDLLAACKDLVNQPTWNRTLAPREKISLEKAHAAIAKAEA